MQGTRKLLGGLLVAALALPAGAWGKPLAEKRTAPSVTGKAKPAPSGGSVAPAAASAALAAPINASPASPLQPADAAAAPAPSEIGTDAPSLVIQPSLPAYAGNPYLAYRQQAASVDSGRAATQVASPPFSLGVPGLPLEGQSILPRITTVYPTGEKPLVVLTFKCPTELIGVTPLPTKALHDLVTLAMDGLNRSNLLAFNLQQVCQ
jgi:hypothetical protein